MSVQKIVERLYVGLASDTKPTTGVVLGAEFIEVDSDQRWVWDGSAWYQVDRVRIDWAHKQLHRGRSFHVGFSTEDGSPLADNASIEVWVSVPADLYPHVVPYFWCEGLAQAYIFEGPTVTDEGTALTPINRNRAAVAVPSLVVKHTPTVTVSGDPLIDGRWMGGVAGVILFEGRSRGDQELVLNSETTYLFRVTARAATVRAMIELDWYQGSAS